MSYEELRVVIVVYVSALLPIYILFFRMKNHPLQKWLKSIYAFSFLTCALSWELWFTYGWINGDSVSNRRSDSLNTIIPQDINWLLNSMADAGAISIGGIVLIWLIFKKQSHFFESWNWQYFIALLIFTLSQNILVEMFLYFDQLSIGKPLSWAPFSPFGGAFNPELFNINDRSIQLQTQIPWVIMTPILYFYAIITYRRIYKEKD
tara:strand:- start:114 stop:731 length:618 start_codon:yes stop_codon:yes gene_type:complete